MTSDSIVFRYELTADWAQLLSSGRHTGGTETWVYHSVACMALIALVSAGCSWLAAYIASSLALSGTLSLVAAGAGWIAGVALVLLWLKRLNTMAGYKGAETYPVGSEAIYDIGPDGFRMRCDGQDWFTQWHLVVRFNVTPKCFAIITPFTIFAFPPSKLPLPVEEALARMTAWKAAQERA